MEELRDVDPTLLSPFYTDDTEIYGSARRSVAQLCLLMDQGPDWEYFPDPSKSLFITNKQEEKEKEKKEFEQAGLHLTYVDGSRNLGDYLGPREDLEAWVRLKVGAWSHGVRNLEKIAKQYPSLHTPAWGCRSSSSGITCKGLSLGSALLWVLYRIP